MGFMDKLKQAAEQATEKAGELAHDNRAKVAQGLDKAGQKFDAQTDGKYTTKVAKAKEMATKAVDKVADQRPGATPGPYGAATPGATPPAPGAPGATPPPPAAPTPGPAGATPPPGPQDPSI